jgi:zinc protease
MPLVLARLARATLLIALCAGATARQSPAAPGGDVFRATLSNGLRVIIIPNAIAPVVSTDMTYLVGSRDDPAAFPGMAHAQEHMLFRGTKNLSTSQLGTLATALGGDFNASTSDTVTQFQFSVPSADLDAILRIESDRMRDVLDAQSEWENERGAIEQEVLRDETSPGNDFFDDARQLAFAGSSYAHDGVGTRAAFDRLTGAEIKTFYERWYAPNNAVFVIAGNVDPAETLERVKSLFEGIPRRAVPAHAVAHLRPIPRTVQRRLTTLVYPLAIVGFRMPGIESPDFLASYVLQEVLDSERGALHELANSGQALDGEWVSLPYVPEGQLGFATAALAPGADPAAMERRLEDIIAGTAAHGVPRELFESTKRRLIAAQELGRNSTEALASDWATTIAVDGEPSIVREQQLIAQVTLDQVDAVARRYLDPRHAIAASLTPSPNANQNRPPEPPQQGPEKPLNVQPSATRLPDWAEELVEHVTVAPSSLSPTQTKLPNGITLIVQPESISDSVFVYGRVRTQPALQEPEGKEGVSQILAAIYDFGTQGKDLAAFQRALDEVDSSTAAGSDFALQTTAPSFDRALALLAENELRPRFDDATFALARRRALEELATTLNGTHYIATHGAAAKLLPSGDPELREPSLDDMAHLTLDDARDYYAATMRPDLTTIVVIGNITPDAARNAIVRDFGGWQATGSTPDLDLPPVPLNGPATVTVTIPSLGQDSVMLQELVPVTRSSPQFYPLKLGDAILGGGSLGPEQSRLFRDLRQNSGLVYNVSTELSLGTTRSTFVVNYGCLPSNEGRITSLIDSEIQKLQTEPADPFELSLAKASIVRGTLIANASVTSIGNALLGDASDGYPLDQQQRDAQRFLATDAGAVRDAFASAVRPQSFVHVIEGP